MAGWTPSGVSMRCGDRVSMTPNQKLTVGGHQLRIGARRMWSVCGGRLARASNIGQSNLRPAPMVWLVVPVLLMLAACSAGHMEPAASSQPPATATGSVSAGGLDTLHSTTAVKSLTRNDASLVDATSANRGINDATTGTPAAPSTVDRPAGFRDAAAEIGPVIWTTGVDPTTKAPTTEVRSFTTETRAMYATAQIRRVQKGTVIAAAWSYNGTQIKELGRSMTPANGQRNVWIEFHLDLGDGRSWPAGTYAITLTIDGRVAERGAVVVGVED